MEQLVQLQSQLEAFENLDVVVLAVSNDTPPVSKAYKERIGVTYDLLSDVELVAIQDYEVHDAVANIAKPSTFIVDAEGVIRWRRLGVNIADHPTGEQVLAEVQKYVPRAVSSQGKLAVSWSSLKKGK